MRALTRLVAGTPLLWSLFYRSLHRTPPADLAEHRRRIVDALRRPRGTEAIVAMADGSTKDATGARRRQSAPVVVVMGERDPDFRDPAAEAQAYADAAAAAGASVAVRMVPGAGHYPHSERPRDVADAVLALARQVGWPVGDRA